MLSHEHRVWSTEYLYGVCVYAFDRAFTVKLNLLKLLYYESVKMT